MVSVYEKCLVGISIILIIIASIIAFNSSFIWMINPPNTKPSYFNDGFGSINFEQPNSLTPVLQVEESLLDGGTFYFPTKVMWANISLISNNLSFNSYNTSQDELSSLKVVFYCGLYTINNFGLPILVKLQNETAPLNGTLTSYSKSFTWNSIYNNSIFYSGEQKIPLYVATAYFVEEEFLSHINQSLYNYSLPIIETRNFILFHSTATKQIIIEGLGIPSLPSNYFSYINWGNFNSIFVVIAFYAIAILIPIGILVRKKFILKRSI